MGENDNKLESKDVKAIPKLKGASNFKDWKDSIDYCFGEYGLSHLVMLEEVQAVSVLTEEEFAAVPAEDIPTIGSGSYSWSKRA